MKEITFLQRAWLKSRGGRTIGDVFNKDGRFCITMRNSDGENETVPIPSDHSIRNQEMFSTSFLTACSRQFT